ncbi:hypothetical protein [Hymenobacter metallilatus]|uniref:hypothetical protein n=1 Tax=Hymenobacter metallilatus TaxID=2493666 RepID=UPI00163AE7AC|nr:hypothetical protein [Hymenobacter metallilatus]
MQLRFLSGLLPVAAVLLGSLGGCDSAPTTRTATDPGTPPFVTAEGNPGPTSPGSAPIASGATAPAETGAPLPDSLHLLSPGRAGRLRLGMSEKRLKRLIPAQLLTATSYQDQGRTLPAYTLLDAQHPDAPASVLHMIEGPAGGWRLRRIRIYSPHYRTAEGIGVGSPFGAARQNLGLTRIRNTPAGLAAVSGQVQMAWVIDPNSLPAKPAVQLTSAEIPPAARITGVLLYQ